MKTCSKCELEKDEADFSKHPKTRDGLQSQCRACQATCERRTTQARRNLVLDHLLTHPCVDCGENDPIVLDFDHVRGKKFKNVSQMVADHASLAAIREEIAKCEVRCSNCHRRVTHKRRLGLM